MTMKNVSFDGSTVTFRLDSPTLLAFDPVCLDGIRTLLALCPGNASRSVYELLDAVNMHGPAMMCCEIVDFRSGDYAIDPREIHKFGDEDQDLDYGGPEDDQAEVAEDSARYQFVTVDSGALILVDFAYLAKFIDLFTWEKYDLALRDDTVFTEVAEAIGGPFYAVIFGVLEHDLEFDGDGVYTITPSAVRATAG